MFYLILGMLSSLCFLAWAGVALAALAAGWVSKQLLVFLILLSLSLLCISYSSVKQSQSVDYWRWGGLLRAPGWLTFLWRWAWPSLLGVLVAAGIWMQMNPKGRHIRSIISDSDQWMTVMVALFLMFMHLWFIGFVIMGDEVAISAKTRGRLARVELKVLDKCLGLWDRLRGKR